MKLSTNYSEAGRQIGELVDNKQVSYGDSFGRSGEVLRVLYPDGVKPDQYDDLLAVTRVIDKLFRLANGADCFGESPWIDIAGYGILGAVKADGARAGKSAGSASTSACATVGGSTDQQLSGST